MQRVIAYVDGFNLYYGLRSNGWKWFYWLNIHDMAHNMLKMNQKLIYTKYFTGIVKQPLDRHERQQTFLDALRTVPDIHISYGHFLEDKVKC